MVATSAILQSFSKFTLNVSMKWSRSNDISVLMSVVEIGTRHECPKCTTKSQPTPRLRDKTSSSIIVNAACAISYIAHYQGAHAAVFFQNAGNHQRVHKQAFWGLQSDIRVFTGLDKMDDFVNFKVVNFGEAGNEGLYDPERKERF